jgi:hypothetical protein
LVFNSYGIPEYIYLNFDKLLSEFTFYTFFTSLFINGSSYGPGDFSGLIGLFFLFFMLFFLYFMARNIEYSYGGRFLIKLYVVGCLFSGLFYILLRLALLGIYPLNDPIQIYVGLAWGGIYGLISYIIFPMMRREVRAFIPMRMSGRSFLILIIAIRLFFSLWYAFYYIAYLLVYLPELGGILGAYVVYRYKFLKKK